MELNFEYLNLNPKGKKASDCVIRALSKALNKEWAVVYIEMAKLGIKHSLMINEKKLEDRYMKANGFTKHKQPRTSDNKYYTIRQFIKEYGQLYTEQILVFRTRKHLTVVYVDEYEATLYDTWDCTEEFIRNFYNK